LRQRLKFQGVIFTDDMQMHAITKHYGLEEAIKLAINGGVDIMTFSNNIQGSEERTVDKVHSIIRRMVLNGEIDKGRIDESFKRILALKARLAEPDLKAAYQQQLDKSNLALEEARREIDAKAKKIDSLELEIEQQKSTRKSKKKKKS
jgi:beta-N-acetylhexosaminidase